MFEETVSSSTSPILTGVTVYSRVSQLHIAINDIAWSALVGAVAAVVLGVMLQPRESYLEDVAESVGKDIDSTPARVAKRTFAFSGLLLLSKIAAAATLQYAALGHVRVATAAGNPASSQLLEI